MTKPKHFHKAQAPVDPLAKFEPYVKPVLIGIGVLVVGMTAIALWRSRVDSRAANQWREFSSAYFETSINRGPDAMSQFGERFPATTAGLAAEQIAGDISMRNGLSKQIQDDAGSKKDLETARKKFEKVVESSTQKEGLMYERAVYSLAYANESLRNCDEAVRWYGELAKNDESTFAELSRRGIERCKLAQSVAFFDALDKFEQEISGPAPGVGLPERPDISYPTPAASESAAPPAQENRAIRLRPSDPRHLQAESISSIRSWTAAGVLRRCTRSRDRPNQVAHERWLASSQLPESRLRNRVAHTTDATSWNDDASLLRRGSGRSADSRSGQKFTSSAGQVILCVPTSYLDAELLARRRHLRGRRADPPFCGLTDDFGTGCISGARQAAELVAESPSLNWWDRLLLRWSFRFRAAYLENGASGSPNAC
jgi:hypothetical protein